MKRAGLFFIAIAAVVAIGCGGSENEGSSSPTGPSSPSGSSNPPPQSSCMPAAPSNLRVAAQNGSLITLEWNAVSNATQYDVLVGTTPSSSNTLSTNTSQTNYTWTAPTGTHYARVQAKNACGNGLSSNEVSFTVTQ
jgi:hypothetical protein